MRAAVGSSLFKWLAQVGLLSMFLTMLLMAILSNTIPPEDTDLEERRIKEQIHRQKKIISEQLREKKLREMQSTMFINNKRPPDSTYNINVTLSDKIPLDRDIPDTRPHGCADIRYNTSTLPTVSVITIFYNEALSMVLRTVHSVLSRTPPELLADVILVNDCSKNEDLGDKLEQYIKLLPDKVKLLRTKKREGLIRARMIGARIARGDVLMFQDAHTEANVGWAEPILEEIRKDPKTIVQPSVEQVEANTLEYIAAGDTVPRGGWTWDLRYVWMEIPQHEKERMQTEAHKAGVPTSVIPFRAAALVGCALAVQKQHFHDIGAFDEGMNVWGGENIELAMRNWMCHGRVITHPCSRVAHTFKPFAYSFDGDRERIVEKNLIRIAEIWMDDWKKYFLASTYNWPSKITYLEAEEVRTLEERRALKKRLQCKSFEWYMKNITPEVKTPPTDAVYYGEVTNLKTEACWGLASDGYIHIHYFCYFHRFLPDRVFHIDDQGRLMFQEKCARIDKKTQLLWLGKCPDNPVYEYWWVEATREVEGMIKVKYSRHGQMHTQCATQVTNVTPVHHREQMVQLMDCDADNAFQYWRFHYKFRFDYDFSPPQDQSQVKEML